jgi:glycosyltransferase involved in cell wall biosynthesis
VRILRLSEAVAERGHKVHVVTYHLSDGTSSRALDIVRTPILKTYNKMSPGPSLQKLTVLDPLLVRTMRRFLATTPIDVIHAHHYEGLIVGKLAARGRKIPLVYDAHTLLASELPFFGRWLPSSVTSTVGRVIDQRLPRLADHVVSVTDAIQQKLGSDPRLRDRITVVQNGVELELFRAPANQDVKRTGQKLVVFSGNLAQYQGIDLLLKGFAIVAAKRADVRLMFVTESSFAEYEALARELGIRDRIDIKAVEFRDIPPLLAAADVLVNPRTACDGIPQKLLNYMAAGRPIVSFEGSAPILEHGRTGWTAKDADIEGFAAGVLHLLADEAFAGSLGTNAREWVLLNRTWERCASLTEEIYLRLLQERRSA